MCSLNRTSHKPRKSRPNAPCVRAFSLKNRADLVPTKSALEIFDYPKSDGGLSLEREAVRALNDGRICLVSADLDFVERAEVLAAAVVLTVVNCTADVLVCEFGSHNKFLL